MPDISDYIVTEKVKCIASRSLLLKHDVKKIDLLSIDSEGYDYKIIKQINFDKLSPLVLIYEHKHIKRDERKRCQSMLRAHRYALRKQRGNTLAYLLEANEHASSITRKGSAPAKGSLKKGVAL